MKAFITFTLCSMLLLTSCNPQQSSMVGGIKSSQPLDTSVESSKESVFTHEVSEISSEQVSSSISTEAGEYNTAFAKLYPDFVLADGALFYVEELGFQGEVPWSRINQIKNLDRGNYETGEYQIYYLITPIYVDSKIKLYPSDFIEEDPYVINEELVYESLNTPDDYALLLTSIEPETFYDYKLTIENGEWKASYYFQYDGKGDRPNIQQVCGESMSGF